MPIEVIIPPVGESITEVQITEWLKAEGDSVKAEEPLAVIDSDKTTFELTAPQAGRLGKILHAAGEKIAVGTVVAHIEAGGEAGKVKAADNKAPVKTQAAPAPAAEKPKAEKPAAEASKEEPKQPAAKEAAPAPEAEAKKPAAKPAPATEAPKNSGAREEEVVPMTMLRQAVGRRLMEAQQTMAMLTTFNEVDMSSVLALRKQYQEAFEKKYQVKLGLMSFFVKAAVDALKQFPQLNAEIRGNNIVYRNYFDVDVAISTERGLVVPALRNAERLSFAELEKAIGDLAKRAKDGKLKPNELEGGTFTITNGGSFGSLLSTPIINPPQTGILGMHSIQERPVAVDGQVVIRPMMYVALTYDHRLVDGREAVLFLRRVKEAIEAPARMLIEI
jgi:2-oxoglutarate dehydrogenase E2 component (dihydrolipoamide succinyltransferase)